MGLTSRRHHLATFFAFTTILYVIVIVLFLLPAPESEVAVDDLEIFERSILARPDDNLPTAVRQNIRAFESSYMVVKPHETEGMYEGFRNEDMEALKKELFKKYSFNELESSKIGLLRLIPDNRPKKCFALQYPVVLPSASVIIIFHNEAWATLLRTIHSVLSRSPPAFLKQIILVDDCSDTEKEFEHLGQKLDDYLRLLPKIQLLRLKKREGIVASRMHGASRARGDVLVFLDSHCEVNKGWLEPLLARIAEDKRHIVTPDIEVIDFETFQYAERRDPSIGIFNWEMLFKWRKMNAFEKSKEVRGLPLRSPTMAGGLFAIAKHYFYEIGSYDTKMSYWGGENLELSFRTWMCGGTIEILPCSKVGHVFRDTMPYSTARGTAEKNIKRLVEVWLDDYKSFVYSMKSRTFQMMDTGDVSDRQELRKMLKCKSFSWYLQNVIPELRIPDLNPLGRGEVINTYSRMCIDTLGNNKVSGKLGIYICHGLGGNQFFIYTKDLELWHNDYCVGIMKPRAGEKLMFYKCGSKDSLQKWEHTRVGGETNESPSVFQACRI